MADRSVVTRFEAKVDNYLAGVTKMGAATEQFAKKASASATKHKADWDKISRTATVTGLALGSVVVGAAKAYADFEQAMSGVAAVADATAQQQKALGEAAIKAGQDTVFSATEAAKAEAELARAGVSVNDIMGGALRGSLDLAAAGQIDLAKSAEIAAQAMNIFDKSGQDVGHIADVLTAGANKSAAGVDDLGMALQQGGLLAKQTGLSLEDTVGTLSAFADNALKGSDAGTSLKTMLQRLVPQSDEQAAAMKDLGLAFYDAQGQFIGIEKVAGQLQDRLAKLTPEQRNAAMATIFGSDAVRGANILMEQGEAGIRKYIDAVNDQGAAQRMAARQTDNLKGDVEQLKGTLESAFIRGGAGGNEGLRDMVQSVTGLVDAFNRLDPATQSNIVKLAAATAGLALLTGGAIKATTSVLDLKKSLDTSGLSASRFGKGMATAGKIAGTTLLAITALGAADQALFDGPGSLNTRRLTSDLENADSAMAAMNARIREAGVVANGFDSRIGSVSDALQATFDPSHWQQVGDQLGGLFSGLGFGDNRSDVATAQKRLAELDDTLASMVQSGHAQQAQQAFFEIAQAATAQGIPLEDLRDKLGNYQTALDAAATSGQSVAGTTILVSNTESANAKTAQDAADATKEWADQLDGLNSPLLDARAAARQFEESIDAATAAVKKNGRTLDIGTAKGRENQAALDAVAKAAIDQIGALQANGASQGTLQKKLETSRARLQATAEKFGMTKAQAKAYADQVLKIPASKTTTATFRTVGLTELQTAGNYLKGLHDKHITLTVGTVKVGNTKVNAGQFAGGGSVEGPGTGTSDSIPALLSNGEHVWTAKEVEQAGGQQAMYRARSLVRSGALRFKDGGAVGVPAKFADGGEVDFSSILSIVRDLTSLDDVLSSRKTSSSKAAAITSAVNALKSLQAQQRKAARDLAAAQRALKAADTSKERAAARDRINDVLDRQRVLLGKVAAAEGKVTAARNASAAAAKATAKVEAEYRADRKPILERTISASRVTNKSTRTFLNDIDRLSKMGFRTLALELLNMGGDEAPAIAAQAVRSASRAKALQAEFALSSSLSSREAALRAQLEGKTTPVAGSSVGSLAGLLIQPAGSGLPPLQVNVNADPGLAREYAGYVAQKTVTAQRDAIAVYGLSNLGV